MSFIFFFLLATKYPISQLTSCNIFSHPFQPAAAAGPPKKEDLLSSRVNVFFLSGEKQA